MGEKALAFLTVPGRAPTLILTERSVILMALTETVYRLRFPSSTRSLKQKSAKAFGNADSPVEVDNVGDGAGLLEGWDVDDTADLDEFSEDHTD